MKVNLDLLKKVKWTKKRIWGTVLSLVLLCLLYFFWSVWLSRTYIAFVNFQPISLQGVAQANNNSFIKLYNVSTDDIKSLGKYDIVFINGMGLNIDAEQRQMIQELANSGKPVYTTMATNPDNNISNFSVDETTLVQEYMMNGGKKNYRSLLSYLRRNIDGKIIFAGEPEKPQEKPADYLYYPASDEKDEDEKEFLTVADYEKFMKANGLFHPNAPKIVVTGSITDPSDLILALAKENKYNVYPVSSFTKLLDYVEEIKPAAVINLAHGRLGDDMVNYLKATNTLLFDPLTINDLQENWEKDNMGMMGGFLSQSVVMPEIDGAIRTSVLFAQRKDKDGLLHAFAVPERLKTFLATVDKYLALRSKPNAQKKVAIVYFKGPGQANLVASGLDVVPSLYNLLKTMQSQGYNLSGLPASEQAFASQIQQYGSLFNSFAAGAAAKFMKDGHPQLVTKAEYDAWTKECLRPDKVKEIDKTFGAFPGDDNMLKTSDGRLAFPRLQYGNIVLLPQPMAGEGKDEFKIVHGTDKVPPHSYIAPYLWLQYGFRADALVHFGTHGSLEFTPQKQVALSNNDWPDRLVGALPHFYLYTIDNVGEGMIAKRRSYAGLISYLTPPFHESELRTVYSSLEDKLRAYSNKKGDKRALALDIKKLSVQLGLNKDLSLDGNLSKPYSEADIERIKSYAEELASEKVTGTPYTLGIAYKEEDIKTSVFSMATDPIAYSRFNIDRLLGRVKENLDDNKLLFNAKYGTEAKALVARLYGNPSAVNDALLCSVAGITEAQLQKAREIIQAKNAPKGMLAMMQAAAKAAKADKKGKGKGKPNGMEKMMEKMQQNAMDVPAAHNNPIAKFMRLQMRKMLAKKDPEMMLKVAKKMGASDEDLKKMKAGLEKQMKGGKSSGMGGMMSSTPSYSRRDVELAEAIDQVETTLRNVNAYRTMLKESPSLELQGMMNALKGGYTAPSPGGDPIANPNTLPTGRNLFAINAEETPTEDAWEKGIQMAKATIEDYRKRHKGQYPRKVSYTLWSGEFIQTGGATIAQVLYMLGVEPVRDRFGRVNDLHLIPSEQLGRPRIDVVVQTSGQLRDLAASRLFLINRAVRMAASANAGKFGNMVKDGVEESERYLINKGVSPKDARELSEYRVFGGVGGNYGSGIQGMVEQGNEWNNEKQIADQYIHNMGAFYGDQDHWQSYAEDVFAAALTRTDAVVQPRQNNTWGALSLDHVYEFMGGMSLAVRSVTGKDPDAYFSDYRNRNDYRVQDSKEAIAVEARTKLFNPSYIKEALKGGASATDNLSEMVRNAYGWNVMKPNAIDKQMWNDIYDVYVKDKYNLGIHEEMAKSNPAAMEELTATMMETARKGYWKATPQQLAAVAKVHTSFVAKFGPSGSSFEGNNPQLQQFIAGKSAPSDARTYEQSIRKMNETTVDTKGGKGMVMKKETSMADAGNAAKKVPLNGWLVVGVVLVLFVALVIVLRRKQNKNKK